MQNLLTTYRASFALPDQTQIANWDQPGGGVDECEPSTLAWIQRRNAGQALWLIPRKAQAGMPFDFGWLNWMIEDDTR